VFIALPLYLTARFLDEDKGLLAALGTTILLIITFLVCTALVPCLGLVLAVIVNLLLIKVIYDTTWGKALVMWIVAIIMAVVITVLVVLLMVGTIIFAMTI
jgi:hypothetical protein